MLPSSHPTPLQVINAAYSRLTNPRAAAWGQAGTYGTTAGFRRPWSPGGGGAAQAKYRCWAQSREAGRLCFCQERWVWPAAARAPAALLGCQRLQHEALRTTQLCSAWTTAHNRPPPQPGASRKLLYAKVLSALRALMIARMAKPEEVIVVEDEAGNIVRETMKDTDVLARYKAMHETLVYLSHLGAPA